MPRAALLTAALALAACSDGPEVVTSTGGASAGIGGGVQPTGGGGAAGAGGGNGGAEPMGGMAPVRLGVIANTTSSVPAPGDLALAELTALAAGVRSVVVDLPLRDVDVPTVNALALRIDDYAQRDLAVVLNLLVVDGHADLRPEALTTEAWNAPTTVAALDSALSTVVAAAGSDLSALVIGRRVDAYLLEHPGDEAALVELLVGGMAQLEAEAIPRGIGLTYVADQQAPATYRVLAALGDTSALAYLPGLGLEQLAADISHAKALDTMIELAEGRPIHLYAAGYPSAASIGSSADVQAQQLDGLFDALDSRRTAFPLVVIQQLHDLDAPSCEAVVTTQGLEAGDPLGDHWCSTGLRDVDGAPKPAFGRFLQAAAHFAQP